MTTEQEEKQESAETTRYRPQLIIDTTFQGSIDKDLEQEEMERYSITPTTFRSRNFFTEPSWYKDTFKYAEQEITRFGINAKSLSPEIITTEGIEVQIIEGSEHTRSTGSYKQEDALAIQHHSLEKSLLQKSINHLLNNEDCRTVLVDIFERSKDKIKIKGGIPKIHTVILYKNPPTDGKYEITVIDPSNFIFSSHLSGDDLDIKHDLLYQITTLHKALQIYKPISKDIGPNNHQSRDCIDLSVKLPFGFNKPEWSSINTEPAIKGHPVVMMISNNTDFDKTVMSRDLAIRIKQSPDLCIVRKFHEISKVLKKNFSIIAQKDDQSYYELMSCYTTIITACDQYSNTLKELVDCNKIFIDELTKKLNLEHQTLIGQINEEG